jgi:hypothetical protein
MEWALLSNKSEYERIFREALNGYGFVEVPQSSDGLFCTGCLTTHKRPTKMYQAQRDVLCKFQVVNLYNPEL